MLPLQWKQVLYFDSTEFDDPQFPGSGVHADALLVLLLDKARITISSAAGCDCPIITHASVGGCIDMQGTHSHADDSYHLYGKGCRACDFHIKTVMNLREQYNLLCQAGFSGIGVYLYSKRPWFHVDTRPRIMTQHWSCKIKGKYEYLL